MTDFAREGVGVRRASARSKSGKARTPSVPARSRSLRVTADVTLSFISHLVPEGSFQSPGIVVYSPILLDRSPDEHGNQAAVLQVCGISGRYNKSNAALPPDKEPSCNG